MIKIGYILKLNNFKNKRKWNRITIFQESMALKQMLVTKDSHLCEFTILENSTVYIFGGEPFAEERFIDWNFVSSSKELIEDAKQRWEQQTFGKIPGDDTEYIPYLVRKK